MAYALGLLSAIVPGYVSRALRGLTFSGRGAGLRQHICCIGETVVQATAIYCLLDTIAVSASAQDWTNREHMDRHGLTARASIPCPAPAREFGNA